MNKSDKRMADIFIREVKRRNKEYFSEIKSKYTKHLWKRFNELMEQKITLNIPTQNSIMKEYKNRLKRGHYKETKHLSKNYIKNHIEDKKLGSTCMKIPPTMYGRILGIPGFLFFINKPLLHW